MNNSGVFAVSSGRPLLVTSGLARLDPTELSGYRASGFDLIERFELNGSTDAEAIRDAISGVWGVLAGTEAYTPEVFAAAPDLKVIARAGVGVDSIDVKAATDHGVAVITAPGANVAAVADLTIGLMLACLRDLRQSDSAVRRGRWRPTFLGRDLTGATVGLVGLGAIGQAVAERLSGFGCRLIGIDPFVDTPLAIGGQFEMLPLREALPRLDVLSLHVPLLESTRGMIGETELRMLPRGAILVNTARGEVVDEVALVKALDAGQLRSAGLDVFESEPLAVDHPLTKMPSVHLSGHIAAFTERSVAMTLSKILECLNRTLAGDLPPECLNRNALLATWKA